MSSYEDNELYPKGGPNDFEPGPEIDNRKFPVTRASHVPKRRARGKRRHSPQIIRLLGATRGE